VALTRQLRFRLLLSAILLLGCGQAALYAHNLALVKTYRGELIPGEAGKTDRQQIYQRGVPLAQHGTWAHYGSHASTDAPSVPGSLETLLAGAPMWLWFSPYAPIVLIQLLQLAAFLLLDNFVRRVFPGSGVRLALAIAFWLNPWRLYQNTLWNPAWLPIASALHLLSAWMLWQKGSARFLWTALHVLAIGFAMQLHHSYVLLAGLSLYLWWRGLAKPHLGGLLCGVLLTALSLIPWFLEGLRDPGLLLGDNCEDDSKYYLGRGLVTVAPLLKALGYWFRYSSTWFTDSLMALTDGLALQRFAWLGPPWAAPLSWLWRAALVLAGAATLALSVQSNWLAFRRVRRVLFRRAPVESPQQWALLYALGACLILLLFAAISPIYLQFWHVAILFPAALLPLLWRCPGWAASHGRRFGGALLALALFLSLVNWTAAQSSPQYSRSFNLQSQFQRHLADGLYEAKPRLIPKHCARRGDS